MDGNQGGRDLNDGQIERDSDGDTIQETSFVTATEGLDDATSRADISSLQHDGSFQMEEKSGSGMPSSSRTMPLPTHLQGSGSWSLQGSRSEVASPPTYNQFVTNPSEYSTASAGPTIASDDDESGLSPEEVAVVMKMRAGNDSYRAGPSSEGESRESYAEAIEMNYRRAQELSPDERDTFSSMKLARPKPRSQRAAPAGGFSDLKSEEVADVEGGQIVSKFLCEGYGPLDRPFTALGRFLGRQSPQRLLIIGAICTGILGLILFVSLFPASFVYVEYHEVALSRSRMTHEVNREEVFYPGCYVLGPDTQLIRFQATAHSINKIIEVFTKDTIVIKMGFSLQYFLRPTEVALLYSKFMMDYDAIFDKIIDSSIKNIAGAEISVDDFRFNRTSVEKILHSIVRRRLGGTCCPACCPRNCQSNTYCSSCSHGNCDPGYHVDVRFFHLLSVDIPQEVFEKYLQRTLLGIESEKEYFLQDHALTLKETELLTKKVTNEAAELLESGNAESKKILQVAEADREVVVQKSYNGALKSFYTSLNVTSEDHKLSLMMIRALDDAHENLYRGYGFEHNTLYKP